MHPKSGAETKLSRIIESAAKRAFRGVDEPRVLESEAASELAWVNDHNRYVNGYSNPNFIEWPPLNRCTKLALSDHDDPWPEHAKLSTSATTSITAAILAIGTDTIGLCLSTRIFRSFSSNYVSGDTFLGQCS